MCRGQLICRDRTESITFILECMNETCTLYTQNYKHRDEDKVGHWYRISSVMSEFIYKQNLDPGAMLTSYVPHKT